MGSKEGRYRQCHSDSTKRALDRVDQTRSKKLYFASQKVPLCQISEGGVSRGLGFPARRAHCSVKMLQTVSLWRWVLCLRVRGQAFIKLSIALHSWHPVESCLGFRPLWRLRQWLPAVERTSRNNHAAVTELSRPRSNLLF